MRSGDESSEGGLLGIREWVAPAIDGQGKLKQSGTEWPVRPCPLYIHW
jgi:hypothetical protein